MTEHLPDRATWDCAVCRGSWPCPAAREELLAEDSPLALAVYMASQMDSAIAALPAARPPELYDRFLAWTRPPGAV